MHTGIFRMRWGSLWLVAAIVTAIGCLSGEYDSALASDRRVALVIGNAAYDHLPQLDNTVHDANLVREALNKIGFEVYFGANLKRIETEDVLKRFYRASDKASISLVYYAGHGLQLGGDNYIVPVDAALASAYDVELQTINLSDIYQYLRIHTSAQLVFLDACRSNPARGQQFWVAATLKSTEQSEGLARPLPSVGSLIAFSTEPGKVAFDGRGPNSPYTSALVRHLSTPNQEIRETLTRVRRDVIAATDGLQVPWENSSSSKTSTW